MQGSQDPKGSAKIVYLHRIQDLASLHCPGAGLLPPEHRQRAPSGHFYPPLSTSALPGLFLVPVVRGICKESHRAVMPLGL